MIEKSRLRLSAGLVALTLALGACGGPDQGAPAPEAAAATTSSSLPAGSPAPSTMPAATSTAAPSPSTTSADATISGAGVSDGATSASAEATSADSAVADDGTTPEEDPSSADSATATSDDGPTPSRSSAVSSEAGEDGSAGASDVRSSPGRKPAPVVVDDEVVPSAQDLGGPKPGVAAKDTPVSVSTPKPRIPVEKVAPEDVRPAPVAPVSVPSASASTTTAPSDTTAPSASAAPTTAAPAPVVPVEQGSVDCSVTRCVALTFDDGPGRHTGRLLNILSAEQVPATFYVLGQSAALNPALISRMAAEGHQIGNHSYTHPNLTQLSASRVLEEIGSADAAIRAAGATPSTVRAPYGALNEAVLADLATLPRAGSVTWSVDTRDWEHRDPAQTLANVKAQTRAGGIILMHDIHSATVDAVPSVIAWLKAQGYTLVTVDTITGGVGSGRTTGSGMHP